MKKRIVILIAVLTVVCLCLCSCDEITGSNGKSAYELAVENGFEGTVTEWLESLKGEKGEDGKDGNDTVTRFSNYDSAVLAGFNGTEEEWLESLKGEQGERGKSAYELAVENGFVGSETEWLESLKGEAGETAQRGLSAYEIAVKNGYAGTEEAWLESLNGIDGAAADKGYSAYEVAVRKGYTGTEEEWLESLKGAAGKSAYEIALQNGYLGTEEEWLDSLVGGNFKEYNALSVATNKALLSAVAVYCQFGENVLTMNYSSAAGVIIYDDKEAGDAYIVTNYHVVYNAGEVHFPTSITVRLYGLEYVEYNMDATFVGGSLTNDIAVIKITGSDVYKNSAAVPAVIADSATVCPGDDAIAIGNPEASGISATSGMVSVYSEEIELTGSDDVTTINPRVIRMDTPVNPGNSGGGLFNRKGELIGIVNAKNASLSTDDMGYAIPSNIAISIADNIIKNCDGVVSIHPRKVLIGITIKINKINSVYNEATQKIEVNQEITVDSINADSSAIGKLEVGDVLKTVTFDKEGVSKTFAITKLWSIADYIFYFDSNETIKISLERNGTPMEVEITLGTANVVD